MSPKSYYSNFWGLLHFITSAISSGEKRIVGMGFLAPADPPSQRGYLLVTYSANWKRVDKKRSMILICMIQHFEITTYQTAERNDYYKHQK